MWCVWGEGRDVHRVLVEKPEGKRPLGRPRRRWEYNIKMDLQEVEGGYGNWMDLAPDRDRWRAFVSTVRNFRVPKKRGISWLAAEPVRFSRRSLLHGVSKYSLSDAMVIRRKIQGRDYIRPLQCEFGFARRVMLVFWAHVLSFCYC